MFLNTEGFLSGVGLGLFYIDRGKVLFFNWILRVRNIQKDNNNNGKLGGDTLIFSL